MVELFDIYEDLTRSFAQLFLYPIEFAEAATMQKDGVDCFAVFLDIQNLKGMADLKGKLAHECGHCATGALHKATSPFTLIEKNEHKANRWMFERYFPPEGFATAFSAGYTTAWELAEWFDMPQSTVEKALQYYTKNKGICFDELVQEASGEKE